MMKFEEAIKKAKVELSQAIYLSECSESKGIRTINFNKADFLSSLIYLAEIGIGRNVPEIINRLKVRIKRYQLKNTNQRNALASLNKKVAEQKAEIEKYENIKTTIDEFWDILLKIKIAKRKEKPTLEELAEAIEEIESEAIKEFAERLKELSYLPNLSLTNMEVVDISEIDNLVNEMTEGDNNEIN